MANLYVEQKVTREHKFIIEDATEEEISEFLDAQGFGDFTDEYDLDDVMLALNERFGYENVEHVEDYNYEEELNFNED